MDLLHETQKKFNGDLFATKMVGVQLMDVREGYAKCALPLVPEHRNAVGGVMGGAIFTLADFAFAVAANTGRPDTVSISSNVSFLNGVKGNTLYAETFCEKDGARTCTYRIEVTDELDTQVAVVMIMGMRVG
jgi:acyl-CoA thioesterase